MPNPKDALRDKLSESRELNITVTGRKSGRPISIPIWFVLEEGTLYLLPVQGSRTQWYKNVLYTPVIKIEAGGKAGEFPAAPVTDTSRVSSVVKKFRAKYGSSDVKKYYSNSDAAIVIEKL
jgi:deazaflavin-dependent oxidoreductase (nitroreductase family)